LSNDPVSRQMRRSLLRYMADASFHPKVEIKSEQLRTLVTGSK
jgi:hypothetical protein